MTENTKPFFNGIVSGKKGLFSISIAAAAPVSCGVIGPIVYDLIAITNINQT